MEIGKKDGHTNLYHYKDDKKTCGNVWDLEHVQYHTIRRPIPDYLWKCKACGKEAPDEIKLQWELLRY